MKSSLDRAIDQICPTTGPGTRSVDQDHLPSKSPRGSLESQHSNSSSFLTARDLSLKVRLTWEVPSSIPPGKALANEGFVIPKLTHVLVSKNDLRKGSCNDHLTTRRIKYKNASWLTEVSAVACFVKNVKNSRFIRFIFLWNSWVDVYAE